MRKNIYFYKIHIFNIIWCEVTISVQYLRCSTTRKRVNFYTTDRKFEHNGFALVTLGDFHSRLAKRGSNNNNNNNNNDRTLVKKYFFRCYRVDDFRANRSLNSSLIHTYFIRRNEFGTRQQLAQFQFNSLMYQSWQWYQMHHRVELISDRVNNVLFTRKNAVTSCNVSQGCIF